MTLPLPASVRDNPLFWWLLRRHFAPLQLFLLLLYIGVAVAFLGFLARWFVSDTLSQFLHLAIAWAAGEFLICWMAADHFFTTWGKLNRLGLAQDLRLSALTKRERTGAMVWANTLLVALAAVIYGVGLWAVQPGGLRFEDPWVWNGQGRLQTSFFISTFLGAIVPLLLIPASLCFTAWFASASCLRDITSARLAPGQRAAWVWLRALVEMGGRLLITLIGGIYLCTVLTALTANLTPLVLLNRVAGLFGQEAVRAAASSYLLYLRPLLLVMLIAMTVMIWRLTARQERLTPQRLLVVVLLTIVLPMAAVFAWYGRVWGAVAPPGWALTEAGPLLYQRCIELAVAMVWLGTRLKHVWAMRALEAARERLDEEG